jgi:hypothetical protein
LWCMLENVTRARCGQHFYHGIAEHTDSTSLQTQPTSQCNVD